MRNLLFVLAICLFTLPLYSQIGVVNCYEPHPPMADLPRFVYVSFRAANEIAPQHIDVAQVLPGNPDIDSFKVADSIWFTTNVSSPGGVRYYDSIKSYNGVTLVDGITRSVLVDMQGKVLAKFPFGLTHVLPDGNMIGAAYGDMIKFDPNLDLLMHIFVAPHHEITTDENGAIYLLSREYHTFMGLNMYFDMLKIYSPDGDLIYEWHVFDHLEEIISVVSKSATLSNLHNPYNPEKGVAEYIAQDPARFFWHLNPVQPDTTFEFTHLNSIQVLPENAVSKKIPAFKKGNLLISLNPYSCYGILDTATGKIEWAGYLPQRTTLHTPLLTPAGTILVFQNSTDSTSLWTDKKHDDCLPYLYKRIPPKNPAPAPESRNWVSINEYDPVTGAMVWEYTATPMESLKAPGLGNAQRLPNGNTLVCVATVDKGGLVFEVTPDKKIVWSYASLENNPEKGTPLAFYRAKRISFELAQEILSSTELPPIVVDSGLLNDNNRFSNYGSTKAENGITLLDEATRTTVIDMNGKALARLPLGFTTVMKDGTLLGEIGPDLIKLDADMNIQWKVNAGAHHEITTDDSGSIYLLTHDLHKFMGLNIQFDVIRKYSAEGILIYEWCVYDHLEEFISVISKSAYLSNLLNPYNPAKGAEEYIAQDPKRFLTHIFGDTSCSFEFTHFNSIQVLSQNNVSGKIPAFRKGNLLLSFNPYSCYGVLDAGSKKIEWVGYLPERTSLHTPLLTAAGSILVFQNSTPGSVWRSAEEKICLQYLQQQIPPKNPSPDPPDRKWVSITEYDPVTNNKIWEYTANPKESIQANGLGSAQRLTNGNTLICVATGEKSKGGRIFEVTPEKAIVWEYISPEKKGEMNLPISFYRAKRISLDIAKKILPAMK